jgi:RHS repeat-associated protein
MEQTCQSLPFGDALSCIAPGLSPYFSTTQYPTEHHFTGKERDAESGNDYFMARYYSSMMGRFMSPDWSAKETPVPYANLDAPQTLNLYQYVENNPLTRVDADGHCPWCVAALVGAAVGIGAEVVADKISGKPVTVRGIIGAAVGGAIVGGSMGLATGEGIAIGAAIAGTSNVVGGIANRAIASGSMREATNPTAVVTDMVVGATAHIGGALVTKYVGSLTSEGRTITRLEQRLNATQSPKSYINRAARLKTHVASLEKTMEGTSRLRPSNANYLDLATHGAMETPAAVHEKKAEPK